MVRSQICPTIPIPRKKNNFYKRSTHPRSVSDYLGRGYSVRNSLRRHRPIYAVRMSGLAHRTTIRSNIKNRYWVASRTSRIIEEAKIMSSPSQKGGGLPCAGCSTGGGDDVGFATRARLPTQAHQGAGTTLSRMFHSEKRSFLLAGCAGSCDLLRQQMGLP